MTYAPIDGYGGLLYACCFGGFVNSKSGELSGKVAIITGAGRGIGAAVSSSLVRSGAKVLLVDIDEQAEVAARELRDHGGQASGFVADLAFPNSATEVVAEAVAVFGRIDVLVNNAGVGSAGKFPHLSGDDFDRVFAVNTRAPLLLAQEASRHMVAQGDGGKIVNVSSSSGFSALASPPIYGASKAALCSLTRSLAALLGPHDINVNAVAPGLTSTAMGASVGDDAAMRSAVEEGPLANLFGRVSTPADVADVIHFLCLPAARQITGQTIHTSAGSIV